MKKNSAHSPVWQRLNPRDRHDKRQSKKEKEQLPKDASRYGNKRIQLECYELPDPELPKK